MCMHEGIECSGPNCPCPCDNCVLGVEDDEEFDCSVCSLTRPHEHSDLQRDDVWGLVPGPDDNVS